MDKREIALLVEKSRQGDNSAFSELYRLTEKQAYFIALRIAKNEDDAYDVLQDCYIKAMQKMDTLDNPENFVAWFNQIVSNTAKNYVIKSKPMLFRDDDDEAAVMDLQVDDSLDCKPDDSLDTDETRAFIRELVDGLPEDKRMCVLMFYFQNMSVTQIAEELGISEGTVKTRLYHSRDKIKQSIEALEKKGVKVRGVAPIPFFVWMLKRMAEGTQISQTAATVIIEAATSSAAAGATAAATATATTATTAASAATATTSATVTAGTTVTTAAVTTAATGAATATGAAVATGVTAKVVAIAVAGAVAVGGGATAVKVVHDKRAEETATVQTEESTEFASENIAVMATEADSETTIEFEGSTLTVSTQNGTTTITVTPALNAQTTTKAQTQKATEASSTAQSTSATTKFETTTTAKQTTTAKPTTTAKTTTTKPTTTSSGGLSSGSTTKPTTTAPTTTEATTVGTATVIIEVRNNDNRSELIYTITEYLNPGASIDELYIQEKVDEYSSYYDDGYTNKDNLSLEYGDNVESVVAGETYTYKIYYY